MDAEAFHRRLSDYVDGELSDGDTMRVAQAIEENPAFAEAYRNMASLTRRLGELPELQPSAGFEFSLRSRILMEARKDQTTCRRVQTLLFPTVRRSILTGAIAAGLALGVSALLTDSAVVDAASDLPISGVETLLEPEMAVRVYGAVNRPVATVPVESVDRGALRQLSQAESYALSRRLYRTRDFSRPSAKGAFASPPQGAARRVPVSF